MRGPGFNTIEEYYDSLTVSIGEQTEVTREERAMFYAGVGAVMSLVSRCETPSEATAAFYSISESIEKWKREAVSCLFENIIKSIKESTKENVGPKDIRSN